MQKLDMLGEPMPLCDEERRQQAVESLHIRDTPPDERIDRVTRLTRKTFQVPMDSVPLIEHDRRSHRSGIGLGGTEAPREDPFIPEFHSELVTSNDGLTYLDAGDKLSFADLESGEHELQRLFRDTEPKAAAQRVLQRAESVMASEIAVGRDA